MNHEDMMANVKRVLEEYFHPKQEHSCAYAENAWHIALDSIVDRYIVTASGAKFVSKRPLAEASALDEFARTAERLLRKFEQLPAPSKDALSVHVRHLTGNDDIQKLIERILDGAKAGAAYKRRSAEGEDPPATRTDYAARDVASLASRHFLSATGKLPSAGHDEVNDPTSDYGKFVLSLFQALGIETNWRGPATEAVRILRKSVEADF